MNKPIIVAMVALLGFGACVDAQGTACGPGMGPGAMGGYHGPGGGPGYGPGAGGISLDQAI